MIACYGGTFDPVHNGHLAAAEDVLTRAHCEEVRLIPCHRPPHRGRPLATSEQRLAMLRLAVQGRPGLVIDDRELRRAGPSYTVDTLEALRTEMGPDVALGWVLGSDAFAELDSWHRWQELPRLAHLLVLERPGSALPRLGPVGELLAERRVTDPRELHRVPAGLIWGVGQRPMTVSATEVRRTLAGARSASHLLPLPVWAYIEQVGLYDSNQAETE